MAQRSAFSFSALQSALFLALLPTIPTWSQSTPPAPADDDIVVIARKMRQVKIDYAAFGTCLLYTSPSPRD